MQDPYRVWFFTQTTGTHTRPLRPGTPGTRSSGERIRNGTEAASVIWTPDRKIKCALGLDLDGLILTPLAEACACSVQSAWSTVSQRGRLGAASSRRQRVTRRVLSPAFGRECPRCCGHGMCPMRAA